MVENTLDELWKFLKQKKLDAVSKFYIDRQQKKLQQFYKATKLKILLKNKSVYVVVKKDKVRSLVCFLPKLSDSKKQNNKNYFM